MRLVDRDLEKKTLKLVTAGTSGSDWLLASLKVENFATKPAIEAFRRISQVARSKAEILSWDDLLHDPTLSESTRSTLSEYKKRTKATKKRCERILVNLEKYRKLRAIYAGLKAAGESLQQESVDADKVAEQLAEIAHKVKSKIDVIKSFTVGQGNNTVSLVKSILAGTALTAIPTGFKAFDRRNRGIFLGSLMVLGATTGGGKTALALQLSRNFADQGARVCVVSLEMDESAVMIRNLSAYSRVELQKLINPDTLTPNERKKVLRAYADRVRELKKKDGAEVIKVPTEDLSIDEVLFSLKSFGYDVIIVDYISLLKDTGGDDQWKQLGNVARFSKIFARNNKCIVVLLAQVTSDGVLRYSKTVQEHADNAWLWVRDQKSKDTHILRIQQPKARNQEDFPFDLLEEYHVMSVRDVPEDYKIPDTTEPISNIRGGNVKSNKGSYNGGNKKEVTKFKKKVLEDEDSYFKADEDDIS